MRRWFARHLDPKIGFRVPLMPLSGAHSLTLPINLNRPLRMRFLACNTLHGWDEHMPPFNGPGRDHRWSGFQHRIYVWRPNPP